MNALAPAFIPAARVSGVDAVVGVMWPWPCAPTACPGAGRVLDHLIAMVARLFLAPPLLKGGLWSRAAVRFLRVGLFVQKGIVIATSFFFSSQLPTLPGSSTRCSTT